MGNKRKNSADLVFIILEMVFISIGISFMITGTCMFLFMRGQMENATQIEATITDISYIGGGANNSHNVFVSYEFEGQQYDHVRLNVYTPSMHEGDTITVYVDNNNPDRVVGTESSPAMFFYIFGGTGLVFFTIGIVFVVVIAKKKSKTKWLLENGRVIHGTVTNINVNFSVRVNGRHPRVVYCSYQDPGTGMIYQFKSRNIYEDQANCIAIGDSIDIYVDPENYAKNYVDVDKPMERIVSYT